MPRDNARNQRYKYFCFTINNYSEEDKAKVLGLYPDEATYLIYGEEVGDSGTPHLQGYIEFKVRKRFTAAKTLLGQGAHLERRRGTAAQAAEYCKKDGAYTETGEISRGQGSRSDLHAVKELLDETKSLERVADEHFGTYLRYERGFRTYLNMKAEKRRWVPEVIVLWGPTGTGKSRRAHYILGEDSYQYAGKGWFDGYNQEDNVLFDDFSGSANEISLPMFLKVLDRYPLQVPVKGGYVNWKPRRIVITSNIDPQAWFAASDSLQRAALARRLTTIHEMSEPWVPPQQE